MQVQNILLQFFMVGVLFFGIGAVQFALHNVDNTMYGSAINRFKDLCTLANVSIVMLDEYCHGYYVHAKAPWGTSDLPLDWLQRELQAEADTGSLRGRGLENVPKSASDKSEYPIQTFQIYIPGELRTQLNDIRTRTFPVETESLREQALRKKAERRSSRRTKKTDPEGSPQEDEPLNPAGKAPAVGLGPSEAEMTIRQQEKKKELINRLFRGKLGENL